VLQVGNDLGNPKLLPILKKIIGESVDNTKNDENGKHKYRVKESGLVLSQALDSYIAFISKHQRKIRTAGENPLLLFNTSSFLRTEVLSQLNIELEQWWNQKNVRVSE